MPSWWCAIQIVGGRGGYGVGVAGEVSRLVAFPIVGGGGDDIDGCSKVSKVGLRSVAEGVLIEVVETIIQLT